MSNNNDNSFSETDFALGFIVAFAIIIFFFMALVIPHYDASVKEDIATVFAEANLSAPQPILANVDIESGTLDYYQVFYEGISVIFARRGNVGKSDDYIITNVSGIPTAPLESKQISQSFLSSGAEIEPIYRIVQNDTIVYQIGGSRWYVETNKTVPTNASAFLLFM